MKNRIYTCFPELGYLSRFVLPFIYNYTKKYKLKILTNKDFSIIIKNYINNNNLELIYPENNIYISYRRGWHGNPSSGNKNNFNIINKIGFASEESSLLYTNTWLENTIFYKEWLKQNKLDKFGNPENTIYEKPLLPDYSQKSQYSIYEYLLKKFPLKPWNKYKSNKHILFDLEKDLFYKHRNLLLQPSKKLIIKPLKNNYIHIFCKNKNRSDPNQIKVDIFIDICKMIRRYFPKLLICCHGNIESDLDILGENGLIDVKVKSLEDSINLYNNSKLLISPWSGMAELALLCGIKNVLYVSNNNGTVCDFQPFNSKLYKIDINNNNYINFIKNKINSIYF